MEDRFCRFCGKPLNFSGQCDCEDALEAQAGLSPQEYEEFFDEPEEPVKARSPFLLYLRRLFDTVTHALAHPADSLSHFSVLGDIPVSFGLFVIRAVCLALFMLMLGLRLSFSIPACLLLSPILSLASSFALTGAFVFFNRMIFQVPTHFANALSVSASSAMISSPFLLTGALLGFFGVLPGLFLLIMGYTAGLFFAYAAAISLTAANSNKRIYTMLGTFLLTISFVLLLILLVRGLYVTYPFLLLG